MKKLLKKALKPAVVSVAGCFGSHRQASSEPRLWVLMYHRILPPTDERFHQEEPGMRVTPDSFDMHLQELKQHFELVSLSDWVRAKEDGQLLPKRACAVTFDDGWQDNYEYAFPLLKKHQVPATLFAVSEKIGTDFQFWPNIIAALLLSGAGPRLEEDTILNLAGTSKTKPDADAVAQCIKQLKARTDAEIFQALDNIQWRSLLPEPMRPALMNWDQLREMQNSGLVEVGSHTCSHRRLTDALSDEELSYEIGKSKQVLEQNTGHPIPLFCFPNGDYSDNALKQVQNLYMAAVTTQRGINNEKTLNHELTRIGMHDDVSNTRRRFNARLSGWL